MDSKISNYQLPFTFWEVPDLSPRSVNTPVGGQLQCPSDSPAIKAIITLWLSALSFIRWTQLLLLTLHCPCKTWDS